MLIFALKPFSGHIDKCAAAAVEVAAAHPQHTFYLEFNDTSVLVTDRSAEDVVRDYHRARKGLGAV